MLDVIPELKNKFQGINTEVNHFENLDIGWGSTIYSIMYDVLHTLTVSIDEWKTEISYGDFSWDEYQYNVNEDVYCYNFDIFLTGMLRELFVNYATLDWEFLKNTNYDNHPIYDHGDFPDDIIDIMNDQLYTREFIKRLQDPYFRWRDSL